jgi:hypothetical protein
MRSMSLPLAVVCDGTVVSVNPGWSALDASAAAAGWRVFGDESSTTFASLAEVVDAALGGPRKTRNDFERIVDGMRVQIRGEEITSAAGTVWLVLALEDDALDKAFHRSRNDLAAAMLQLDLLRGDAVLTGPSKKRADTASELLKKAVGALK